MGYLNNKDITIEAILTKVGRELLANNQPLNIRKFALSDDEVDYSLWNTSHPMGSDFFGQAIQNMPLLEPVPGSNASMINLLYTPATDVVTQVPTLSIGTSQVELKGSIGVQFTFTPSTTFNANPDGYIVELASDTYVKLTAYTGKSTIYGYTGNDTSNSLIKRGYRFTVVSKAQPNTTPARTTVTIKGVNSGAPIVIPIMIYKNYEPTVPPVVLHS